MAMSRFLNLIIFFALLVLGVCLAVLPAFAGPPVALAALPAFAASPDGSSWTALISATSGKACIAAAGTMSSMPGPPADPVGEDG